MTRAPRYLLVLFMLVFLLSVLALPLALVQRPAAAATPPPAVSGGARIDEPRANSSVRGVVRVTGTAALPNFAKYQMYIQRPGSNAFEWKFERNQPVVNGVLWEWNTNPADYPDGNYVLRMWVVKSDGNYDEVTVPVRVDNSSTPTPSPTATGAPVTPTPARTPTAIVVATPAVIGIAPTATPRADTHPCHADAHVRHRCGQDCGPDAVGALVYHRHGCSCSLHRFHLCPLPRPRPAALETIGSLIAAGTPFVRRQEKRDGYLFVGLTMTTSCR